MMSKILCRRAWLYKNGGVRVHQQRSKPCVFLFLRLGHPCHVAWSATKARGAAITALTQEGPTHPSLLRSVILRGAGHGCCCAFFLHWPLPIVLFSSPCVRPHIPESAAARGCSTQPNAMHAYILHTLHPYALTDNSPSPRACARGVVPRACASGLHVHSSIDYLILRGTGGERAGPECYARGLRQEMLNNMNTTEVTAALRDSCVHARHTHTPAAIGDTWMARGIAKATTDGLGGVSTLLINCACGCCDSWLRFLFSLGFWYNGYFVCSPLDLLAGRVWRVVFFPVTVQWKESAKTSSGSRLRRLPQTHHHRQDTQHSGHLLFRTPRWLLLFCQPWCKAPYCKKWPLGNNRGPLQGKKK